LSFETLLVTDVEQTAPTAPKPMPDVVDGQPVEYSLRLLSAKANIYQPGGLAFDIVVTEGPYTRRHIFPTLPAPDSKEHWAAQAAAKFLNTLGVEQIPGENFLDAFNRAAQNGHSAFIGTTKQYKSETKGVQSDLNWFSVKPVGA
jgi:hypothetical protein